MNNFWIIFNH